MTERVPDLMVEKLALGELSEAEAKAVRERLAEQSGDRLEALRSSNAEILREHPPEQVAAQVRRRLARLEEDERAPRRAGWMVWAPVAMAAGLALVWWTGRGPEDDGQPEVIAQADSSPAGLTDGTPAADEGPETIYLKGDPQLIVDRIEEQRPVRMQAGAEVAAGDRLQVSYRAAGAAQGVIVSIDGAGVATLHFPASEDAATTLDQGGSIPLGESYELDDAPGFERFFFVTAAQAEPVLETATVMQAARDLAASDDARKGALALPEGWRQQSLLLTK